MTWQINLFAFFLLLERYIQLFGRYRFFIDQHLAYKYTVLNGHLPPNSKVSDLILDSNTI